MKKRFSSIILLSILGISAFAQKITIKNTLGGDADEFGDGDFFAHTKETDISGETKTANNFFAGDQLQADFESDILTARARLELLYTNSGDASAKFTLFPSGFAHFEPISQFGIVFGNGYGKRFAARSAFLAAADDTTKTGRLLTDTLGREEYFGGENFCVKANGFSAGATSNWTFGEFDEFFVKAAAGATIYPDSSDTEAAADFGVNAGIEDGFDFAFTAHNVNSAERKFGAFLGLTSIQNLILNAHFYYNFTDSDFLTESRVERSGADEFKKQKTKYALGASGGYKFSSGFGIYADLISGLTNEYIGDIKYYDSDGNLIETKTATIVRGQTIVKYKNGKAKRTDEFVHGGVPFYSQIRVAYDVSDEVLAEMSFKIRALLRDADSTWFTIYPRASVNLPQKIGTVKAGIRLDFNTARYHGLSSVSVPISYTYKTKKKI